MPIDTDEIPLDGGNVSAGIVRVGDTVRRPLTPHSPTVHRFLEHLRARGFSAAPRYLGIDEKDRAILSYLPGDTAFPPDIWTATDAMIAAAKMLRAMHDASVGFMGDSWARIDPGTHEVICHNDFAPYNMVFADGLPVGVIDFDLVGPGPRLRDLAYLAYWMVPLSFGSGEMGDAGRAHVGGPRLRLICKAYGVPCDNTLLTKVSEVLHHMSDADAAKAMIGPKAAQRLADGGHFDHWRKEAAAFDAKRPALL